MSDLGGYTSELLAAAASFVQGMVADTPESRQIPNDAYEILMEEAGHDPRWAVAAVGQAGALLLRHICQACEVDPADAVSVIEHVITAISIEGAFTDDLPSTPG